MSRQVAGRVTVVSIDRGSSLIVGHMPAVEFVEPCCRSTVNWQGRGDARPFGPPRMEAGQLVGDPYFNLGYRTARDVECAVCHGRINAHEYIPEVTA